MSVDVAIESAMTALEKVHTFMAICRGDMIVAANSAALRLLGHSRTSEVEGKRFAEFLHPDFKDVADLGLAVFADDNTVISVKLQKQNMSEVEAELWVARMPELGPAYFLVEILDQTKHLRTARALRSREQRLEGILNTVADGVVSLDDKGIIQSFNPAAERLFGFSREEALGKNINFLMPLPLKVDVHDDLGTEWAEALSSVGELTCVRKDGAEFPAEISVRELQTGSRLSFTSVIRDISERKREQERIRHLAHHDTLTGLPNRYLLGDRLEEARKRAVRNGLKVALLFIDLNKFKPINDELGHEAGDLVLAQLAERLGYSVRNTDTAARVGGDEFVVVLEGLHNREEIERIVEKIHDLLLAPVNLGGVQRSVGASIGVSVYPDNGTDMTRLLNAADLAMYSVKHETTNASFAFFDENETPLKPSLTKMAVAE